MLHQNEEKSKQEKEGQQRFMGAMKTLGIAGLLWQSNIRKESGKQDGENDGRTLGELVYCVFDEVRDMELADSLQMLFDILLTGIRQGTVRIEEAVRVQLMNWFCSHPRFIQCLFRRFFSSLDSAKSVPA